VSIVDKQESPELIKLFEKYETRDVKINGKTRRCLANVNADPGVTEQTLTLLSSLLKNNTIRPTLLNVGCGLKEQNVYLDDLGFNTYGVDIDVQEDSEHFKYHNLNKMDDLPFEGILFDVVLCQEIIEHIENPWLLYRKIKKILKPNGYLLVTTPNVCCFASKSIFCTNGVGYSQYFNKQNLWQHINPIPFFEMLHIASYNDFELMTLSGNKEFYLDYRVRKELSEMKKNEVVIYNNDVLHYVFRNKNNEVKDYIPIPTYNFKWE
jgi:SAM-dependent methyltransferase